MTRINWRLLATRTAQFLLCLMLLNLFLKGISHNLTQGLRDAPSLEVSKDVYSAFKKAVKEKNLLPLWNPQAATRSGWGAPSYYATPPLPYWIQMVFEYLTPYFLSPTALAMYAFILMGLLGGLWTAGRVECLLFSALSVALGLVFAKSPAFEMFQFFLCAGAMAFYLKKTKASPLASGFLLALFPLTIGILGFILSVALWLFNDRRINSLFQFLLLTAFYIAPFIQELRFVESSMLTLLAPDFLTFLVLSLALLLWKLIQLLAFYLQSKIPAGKISSLDWFQPWLMGSLLIGFFLFHAYPSIQDKKPRKEKTFFSAIEKNNFYTEEPLKLPLKILSGRADFNCLWTKTDVFQCKLFAIAPTRLISTITDFPSWHVFLDGKFQTKNLRTDPLFVSPGPHEFQMSLRPSPARIVGTALSLASLLFSLVLVIFLGRKKDELHAGL